MVEDTLVPLSPSLTPTSASKRYRHGRECSIDLDQDFYVRRLILLVISSFFVAGGVF